MPQFILEGADAPAFRALDAFTQGYIEALFFTETEPGTTREDRLTTRGTVRKAWRAGEREGQHKDMPGDYGAADLAPETLAQIIADCDAFRASLPKDGHGRTVLDLAYDYAPSGYDDAQAGRDFWFTRNGHGVGFWDRGLGAVGDTLTESCGWRSKSCFGEVDAYVGDDGKVYLS